MVVIEFPDRDHALEWYDSPAYQAILPLRTENTDEHGVHRRRRRARTIGPPTCCAETRARVGAVAVDFKSKLRSYALGMGVMFTEAVPGYLASGSGS